MKSRLASFWSWCVYTISSPNLIGLFFSEKCSWRYTKSQTNFPKSNNFGLFNKGYIGVCHFSWVSSDVRREKNWTSTRGKVTPTRGRAGPWHEPAAIWTPRTGKYFHSTHTWTSSINESKSVLLFYMFYWIQCGYLIWK